MGKPQVPLSFRCQSTLNQWGLFLRQALRWTPGAYVEPRESKTGLFTDEATLSLENQLINTYSLTDLQQQSSNARYIETLTYLHFIEQLMDGTEPLTIHEGKAVTWLDVGAKNWAYVAAIDGWLKRNTKIYQLTGIELDGYRRYTDLHTRADYAQTYISTISQATYEVGDIMNHQGQYHIISCFLPFVFEEPCLAWGLPLSYFRPKVFLAKLLQLLAPGGILLVMNQGESERDKQEELFKRLDGDPKLGVTLNTTAVKLLDSPFIQYQYPRYGWFCRPERIISPHVSNTSSYKPESTDHHIGLHQ
ncbi:MAG: hypothetical protein KTR14_06990 [Vampirovibrio sp.]|nr:hypothetical protein [Vampirovibrio sp.]